MKKWCLTTKWLAYMLGILSMSLILMAKSFAQVDSSSLVTLAEKGDFSG